MARRHRGRWKRRLEDTVSNTGGPRNPHHLRNCWKAEESGAGDGNNVAHSSMTAIGAYMSCFRLAASLSSRYWQEWLVLCTASVST